MFSNASILVTDESQFAEWAQRSVYEFSQLAELLDIVLVKFVLSQEEDKEETVFVAESQVGLLE